VSPCTAEVASSSLVVPASFLATSKDQRIELLSSFDHDHCTVVRGLSVSGKRLDSVQHLAHRIVHPETLADGGGAELCPFVVLGFG
jgi:hypothetical protein